VYVIICVRVRWTFALLASAPMKAVSQFTNLQQQMMGKNAHSTDEWPAPTRSEACRPGLQLQIFSISAPPQPSPPSTGRATAPFPFSSGPSLGAPSFPHVFSEVLARGPLHSKMTVNMYSTATLQPGVDCVLLSSFLNQRLDS
jgi:hypothetical protein